MWEARNGNAAGTEATCLPRAATAGQRSMRLVLLRHGPAVDRAEWSGPDPLRPLTAAGRERTRRVVRAVAPLMRAIASRMRVTIPVLAAR